MEQQTRNPQLVLLRIWGVASTGSPNGQSPGNQVAAGRRDGRQFGGAHDDSNSGGAFRFRGGYFVQGGAGAGTGFLPSLRFQPHRPVDPSQGEAEVLRLRIVR